MGSYPPCPFPVDYAGPSCQDCGAIPGEPHGDGCDTARCLFTGGQRLVCGSLGFLGIETPAHDDCGDDVWTGRWPGTDECAEFGWWCLWVPPGPGERYGEWRRVGKDHPRAQPNLNRLVTEARWDRGRGRWVLREAKPAPEVILVRAVKAVSGGGGAWDAWDASGGYWALFFDCNAGDGWMGRGLGDKRLTFTAAGLDRDLTIEEFCVRIGVTWAPGGRVNG